MKGIIVANGESQVVNYNNPNEFIKEVNNIACGMDLTINDVTYYRASDLVNAKLKDLGDITVKDFVEILREMI